MLVSKSRAWEIIDYDAIAHNVEEIQKLVGNEKIMGIVKANAYGHGAVECAKALKAAGVDFFAVATIDEALQLREGGIEENILILGYTPLEHIHYLVEKNLIQTLVSLDYAKELNTYAKKNNTVIRGHCKVDTGMGRIGIVYQDNHKHMDEIIEEYQLPNVQVEGIFSHFPISDELDKKAYSDHQVELFEEVLTNLKKAGIDPGIRHIQNSYGILNFGDLGYDYCRPGLLYMGVTSDDTIPIASNPDFIPIMSLYANISMIKEIDKGQSISYGRHFIAEKPTKVASITIGYADGLPRICSNKGLEVLVHGKRCKIIGNICMDQCMVDVTDVEDVKAGDVVCIVGVQGDQKVTIDEISRKANTINNETLCGISARVPRIKKKG